MFKNILVALCFFLSSLAIAEATTIGVVLNPEGKFINIQKPIYRGIQLFLKDKSDVKVELIEAEDDLAGQMKAAKEVVRRKIKFVIGHNFSSSAQMFLKALPKDYRLSYVSPMATSLELTNIRPGVFLVWPNNNLQVEAMTKFVKSQGMAGKPVAILVNESETYSTDMAKSFEAKTKSLGSKNINRVSYIKGDDNLSDEVEKLLKNNPSVIFLPAYSYDLYNVYASLIPKLAKMKHPPLIISGDTVGKEEVMSEKIGSLKITMPDTFYFTNGWHQEIKLKDNQSFVTAYESEYKTAPSNGAVSGYEAARVLYAGIKNANKKDPVAVDEALRWTKLKLTVGNSGMQKDHTMARPVVLMRITSSGFKYHGVY